MGKFPIACWAQPPEHYPRLVKEGIWVMINPETGNPRRYTQAQVHQMVIDAGGVYIDKPETEADLERMVADYKKGHCMAISACRDEPCLYLTPPNVGGGVEFAKQTAALIAEWQWISKKVAGRAPLMINFAGPKVTAGTVQPPGVPGYSGGMQKIFIDAFMSIPPLPGVERSIIMSDWYPMNNQGNTGRYTNDFPALSLSWLKKWFDPTGGKFRHWAFVEISDQMLDKSKVAGDPKNIGRAPTPADVEEQLRFLFDAGCEGFGWFTHGFVGLPWNPNVVPNAWDASDDTLRAKRREIALRLNPPTPTDPAPNAELAKIKDRLSAVESGLSAMKESIAQVRAGAVTGIEIKKGF